MCLGTVAGKDTAKTEVVVVFFNVYEGLDVCLQLACSKSAATG